MHGSLIAVLANEAMGVIKKLIITLFVIVCLPAIASESNGTTYVYRTFFYPQEQTYIIVNSDRPTGSAGSSAAPDVKYKIKFCPPDSEYVCMIGGPFPFAVPKDLAKADDSWDFHDEHFTILDRNYVISLLGHRYKTYLIKVEPATKGRQNSWFRLTGFRTLIYSPNFGVLGVSGQMDPGDIRTTIWAAQGRGIGAIAEEQ